MKNRMFKVVFLVWVALWSLFTIRGLFAKGGLSDYRVLLSRSLEGKHSYVTGDRFYEFLTFCKTRLPEDASYRLIGSQDGSIEMKRAVYYLYPHLEKDAADFLLVFGKPEKTNENYRPFARLDDARYMLKKVR